MIATEVNADIQDTLDFLMLIDNAVAMTAILECLAQIPSDLREAVWQRLPAVKYQELQSWSVELLLDPGILDGELFYNGSTPVQRVLTAFKVLPQDLKLKVWSSIPSSRQQQLKMVA